MEINIRFIASGLFLLISILGMTRSASVDHGPPVTDICLGCICQAVSNCNVSATCDGSTCGLFKITEAYWVDSGRPRLEAQPQNNDYYPRNDYVDCVLDPRCAARSVQGYMTKLGKDCNNDGVIDCYDYMAIHKLGGYGCGGYLPLDYSNRFNSCLQRVQDKRQQG